MVVGGVIGVGIVALCAERGIIGIIIGGKEARGNLFLGHVSKVIESNGIGYFTPLVPGVMGFDLIVVLQPEC